MTEKEVLRLFEFHNAFPVLQPEKPQEYILLVQIKVGKRRMEEEA